MIAAHASVPGFSFSDFRDEQIRRLPAFVRRHVRGIPWP